jgi:hypothetical protein
LENPDSSRPRRDSASDGWLLELYAEREHAFERDADLWGRRSVLISNGRLILFCGGVLSLAVATWGGRAASIPLLVLGAAALAGFAALLVVHARVDERRDRSAALASVNRAQASRVRRDWHHLPIVDAAGPGSEHSYADDLDLFGRASVFALLGPPATAFGRRLLRRWLLGPADPTTISIRQAAIAELAPALEYRQALQAIGGAQLADEEALERFLGWAEGELWLHARRWLVWTIRILTALTLGSVALSTFGLLAAEAWPPFVLASLALWFVLGRRLADRFNRADAGERLLRHYAELFRLTRERAFRSARLAQLRERLAVDRRQADMLVLKLDRLLGFANLRRVPFLQPAVNALTLWDAHVMLAIERWQVEAGRHVREWLDALGEIEALSAFASVAHDNPDWTYPTVDPAAEFIEARDLGHPLIPRRPRVTNDVAIGPPGTFLLVTGSNMSGKSTLIRAVGVNVVLAQAGGPVCASRLRLPPVSVYTSMRVQDSLEQGLSYFMAALARLKRIVDRARDLSADRSQVLLYLLDEILQGTNTAERQIAVRAVLRHLLGSRAIGAITTHDLTLADAPDLHDRAHPVHFTEIVEERPGGGISFDYRLRPGIASSQNALRLMRLIGINPDER